ELFEQIVDEVGKSNDLLSLALTCRAFYQVIIPWHLEYRRITCDVERTSVWKSLCDKPYLASRLQ
ncbi:hypothetical protein M422DRAFT_99480, partial [Sphaerobolus stellatus SS14]